MKACYATCKEEMAQHYHLALAHEVSEVSLREGILMVAKMSHSPNLL